MKKSKFPQLPKINLKEIGIRRLLLLIAAGVVLVICSFEPKEKTGKKDSIVNENTQEITTDTKAVQTQLEEILSMVEGVGKVKVLITYAESEEKVLAKQGSYSENNTNETDSSGGTRVIREISKGKETVYTSDTSGKEIPFVTKEKMPPVEGVLVIAQGGENPVLIRQITKAVSSLLNISSTKISVMKMK